MQPDGSCVVGVDGLTVERWRGVSVGEVNLVDVESCQVSSL